MSQDQVRRTVKCKLCPWQCAVWYHRGGKTKSGWDRLAAHMSHKHEDAHHALIDKLDADAKETRKKKLPRRGHG